MERYSELFLSRLNTQLTSLFNEPINITSGEDAETLVIILNKIKSKFAISDSSPLFSLLKQCFLGAYENLLPNTNKNRISITMKVENPYSHSSCYNSFSSIFFENILACFLNLLLGEKNANNNLKKEDVVNNIKEKIKQVMNDNNGDIRLNHCGSFVILMGEILYGENEENTIGVREIPLFNQAILKKEMELFILAKLEGISDGTLMLLNLKAINIYCIDRYMNNLENVMELELLLKGRKEIAYKEGVGICKKYNFVLSKNYKNIFKANGLLVHKEMKGSKNGGFEDTVD